MNDPKDWPKPKDRRQPSRFFETLGMHLLRAGDGEAAVELRCREALGNRKGDVHGGAIASLIDVAMSEAIRASLRDVDGLATISMTINYLDVGRGDLAGTGKATRLGRTTAFATAEIRDGAGTLVATGQGVFRIIR
jgi:uncharacterized protein (TIGR00369 family)